MARLKVLDFPVPKPGMLGLDPSTLSAPRAGANELKLGAKKLSYVPS